MGAELNVPTLRNNLHKVAGRMEAELGDELGDERQQFVESGPNTAPMNLLQAEPKPPLAVGLDGAYVHAARRESHKEGWFKVIVGKSSDGEVTMRRLQLYLSPQSEHILDWFHVTMKLTVMKQMRKAMVGTEPVAWLGTVEQDLESLK